MTHRPPATPEKIRFRSNSEIAIQVPDLAAAEAFYGAVLGFPVVDRSDDHLEFATGALRLFVNRDANALRSFIPSFDVPNSAAARRYLESAGCGTVPMPAAGGGVYYRDPFGFIFDIVERTRR